MSGPYDPDVENYLALVRKANRPRFESLTVEEARNFYRAGRDSVNLPSIDIGSVDDLTIMGRGGAIGLRHYRPLSPVALNGPVIFFIHGGGWVIGDLDTHDSICRHLVDRTGLPLLAVDYRLAPEHSFPAAVDDVLDAHVWLIDNAARLDVDADNIILMGDSAGGCLAIVTALSAQALGRPRPLAQCLFYPVTDLRGNRLSYRDVENVPITSSTMHWFLEHYLNDVDEAEDWRASPILASNISDLPPTFVTVAEHDPLRDEGLAFADLCRSQDVDVSLRYLPGQVHGYLTLGRILSEADKTIDAVITFIRSVIMRKI